MGSLIGAKSMSFGLSKKHCILFSVFDKSPVYISFSFAISNLAHVGDQHQHIHPAISL